MSDQTIQNQQYMVSVYEPTESVGTLVFTFVPKGPPHEPGGGGAPSRKPQFIVSVREQPQESGELAFEWGDSSDDPGAARNEIQEEVAARLRDRNAWLDRVTALVKQMESWAVEMDWSTRLLEKSLDDTRIGKHRVPVLLMQQETCRVLLEPIGRASPGTEGVVDLYLMPAYDDIASLFFYNNQWNLHYMLPGDDPVADVRDAEALPLSKGAFERVLLEMKQNAT